MNAHAPVNYNYLPHSIEAEQQLLGAVLMSNDIFFPCSEAVEAEHFYEPIHARLWTLISERIAAGQSVTPVTLMAILGADGFVDLAGMTVGAYIAHLAAEAITIIQAPHYAKVVRDLWARRRIILLTREVQARAISSDGADIESLLDDMDAELGAVRFGKQVSGVSLIGDLADRALKQTADAYKLDGKVGFDTGIGTVDGMIGPIMAGDLVTILAPSGHGKGQPLDAKVLTPRGFTDMGNLSVGTAVTAPDGTICHVIGIYPLGERQLFKVMFGDGTSTEVTEDHLWLAWCRQGSRYAKKKKLCGENGAKIYTTAKMIEMLASSPWMRFHIPVNDPVPFTPSRWRLKLPPYVMGALLGDGDFTGAMIRFTTADKEIIDRLEKLLGCVLRFSQKTKSKAKDYRIAVGTGVRAELEKLGLYGLKSAHKFIPHTYLHGTTEERWELLRGLMDTDGWVNVDGDPRFISKSTRMADEVAWVGRSLGAAVTKRDKNTYYVKDGKRVDCGIAREVRLKFMDGAQAFHLSRKKAQCKKPQSVIRTIVSIEPSRVAQAQCIKVSHPSSLYITDDFIVTHNSAIAAQILRRNAMPSLDASRGTPGMFFSMEMAGAQVARRVMATDSGITTRAQKAGEINQAEYSILTDTARALRNLPLYVDQSGRQKTSTIVKKLRAMKKAHGIRMAAVDHLLLIQPENAKWSKFDTVDNAAIELKDAAKELDIAILLLAQVTREAQKRETWRVRDQDLFGGDGVKQASDIFLTLCLPEKWLRQREPEEGSKERGKWESDCLRWHGKAEIGVPKARDGDDGSSRTLAFDGRRMIFSDL